MNHCAALIYWVVAVTASALYGWNAVTIFKAHIKGTEPLPEPAWWWHQRWLNFVGAFVGWISLWLLLRKFGDYIFGSCVAHVDPWDALGALVAFVGITGYLPGCVFR